MENPRIKAVGNASPEQKEQEIAIRETYFSDHLASISSKEKEELQKFEYKKTEKELALINFANLETNRLLKEAGVEPYEIPVENFHILPAKVYSNRFSGQASTNFASQGIFFNEAIARDSGTTFGSSAIHEALHLKSFQSIEVIDRGDGTVKTNNYRAGIRTNALEKHSKEKHFHQHFRGLDEGIVSIQQKKSTETMMDLPILGEEKGWMATEKARQLKKERAEKLGAPEDDIIWVSESGKDYSTIMYPRQREVVIYVCEEILKEFPDKYKDFDEVFKEFLNASLNGNMMTIGRLVEKTFGEGGFRILGNTPSDYASDTVLQLETLKRSRSRFLKSK